MEITRLHGTTSADLLAIPVIMLGFHPRESCVVLGVRGTRVEFCARMDLDWFTSGFGFGKVAEQLENAVAKCPGGVMAVLAYTADPEAGEVAVNELVAVVGEEIVAEALVTDGDRFWYANAGMLRPPEGIAYSYASSNFAAQAVFSGVNVTSCRENAVAEVQPPTLQDRTFVAADIAAARSKISSLDPAERLALLTHHMASSEPLGPHAAELVVLLQEEEHFGEILAQSSIASAARFRPRLAEARRRSPDALAANVLSLLALSCWLDGEGAQQSECLTQLEALDPYHPLMDVLKAMHHDAVPPSEWDG
ncbi:MAG: DUF4192 family protein [Propionibacteriaceae bacterium]|nr:DUF4192 family protein [Propionibacteriaceae bacterium]